MHLFDKIKSFSPFSFNESVPFGCPLVLSALNIFIYLPFPNPLKSATSFTLFTSNPPPTIIPSRTQKPTSERLVRAPTGKQGTQNPPRWPPLSGKDSGEPVADVVEEEKERRRRGLKGFALFGVLIGTAICVAIISVLGVGYYAYRTRQKTMRLRGRSRGAVSG